MIQEYPRQNRSLGDILKTLNQGSDIVGNFGVLNSCFSQGQN